MRNALVFGVIVVALAGVVLVAQGQRSDEVQFKAAQHQEEVEGDLTGAIALYRTLAQSRDRALAARALMRMAECHEKLGQAEARAIYERIVRDFSDQRNAVTEARARLGSGRQPSQAGVDVTLKALSRSNVLPGTVSSDGRHFSYTSWDDGNLYVRDLTAGTDRPLTKREDFSASVSAISRDGRFVAYGTYTLGCEGTGAPLAALCLVPADDGGMPTPRTLVKNDEISEIAPMDWSPDGRTIAVSVRRNDRTAQVALVSVADRSVRTLQTIDWRVPTRILFSPDGRELVFDVPTSDTGEQRDIVMLAIDGSRKTTVVAHPSQNVVMGWSPDGTQLLFATDRGGSMSLWSQPFAAGRPQGSPHLVRSNIGGSWSSGVTKDGALYFSIRKNDRDVFIATLDLQTGTQVTAPVRPIQRYVGTNLLADWSDDGRYLAYISQRGLNPTNNNGRVIGIRTMATGEEREIDPRLLYFGPITWSPDGKALLTAGTDFKGRSGVFTIDAQTGAASFIVEARINAYPQWSRDGRRVFYRQVNTSRDGTLVERDLASGNERSIASGEFAVFSVSPDGRAVATSTGGLEVAAASAIVEIRVDTGETRELLRVAAPQRFPPFIAPQWTPDGRAVLVRKHTPNELWLVPISGTPRRLDVDVSEWSFGGVGQISIHPDGRRISFLSGTLENEMMVLEHFLPAQATTASRR